MICRPCKDGKHGECPSVANYYSSSAPTGLTLENAAGSQPLTAVVEKYPTGLSPVGEAIQRSGLCPCHHRVAK